MVQDITFFNIPKGIFNFYCVKSQNPNLLRKSLVTGGDTLTYHPKTYLVVGMCVSTGES